MEIHIAIGAIWDGKKMHLHAGTPEQITLWLFSYVAEHWHERFDGAKPSLVMACTELQQVEFINEFFAPQPDKPTLTYTVAIQTLPLTVNVAQ